jgi:hypothetical protein
MARGFLRYKAYPFISKDPIINVLRTLKSDTEMTNRQIQDGGGPTTGTLNSWFKGKTRRPQFATVAAAAVSMGATSLPLTSEGRAKINFGK